MNSTLTFQMKMVKVSNWTIKLQRGRKKVQCSFRKTSYSGILLVLSLLFISNWKPQIISNRGRLNQKTSRASFNASAKSNRWCLSLKKCYKICKVFNREKKSEPFFFNSSGKNPWSRTLANLDIDDSEKGNLLFTTFVSQSVEILS